MAELLEIAAAWERVAEFALPLGSEVVGLGAASGRIATQDLRSVADLPPFDRSAMDGFALRSADTDPPRPLALVGEVAAGDVAEAALPVASASGIATGGALPAGADAILRVEDATRAGAAASTPAAPLAVGQHDRYRGEDATLTGETVTPAGPVPVGQHVRYRGEDVRAGDVLVAAGERLTIQRIGALASAGLGEVAVGRRPRVSIIATGSELLEIGAPPEPGRVHESNRLVLRLLVEAAGATARVFDVVPDDAQATRAAVAAALDGADMALISGGISVGPHDHVKPSLQACGVREVFWRVRLKPGKPLWFGQRDGTLAFGLPGNPLSAVACFLLFAEPALRRLQGQSDAVVPFVPVRLTSAAEPSDGRTTLLTSRLERAADGVLEATPTEGQGSHLSGALGASDAFVVVPHGSGSLPAGAIVDALLLPG